MTADAKLPETSKQSANEGNEEKLVRSLEVQATRSLRTRTEQTKQISHSLRVGKSARVTSMTPSTKVVPMEKDSV
jgi:hypothetical protein